ncbi:hypothetical protein M3Y99_00651800 [Aphelenchoides fujianensis]|nr:hypothetical protein M3Y99_00651800 [Aphelenchoides fujianensis]
MELSALSANILLETFALETSEDPSDSFLRRFNKKKNNSSRRNTRDGTTSTNSYTIVALMEGRGDDNGTVGMAAVDLRFLEVTLYQFVDTSSYTLLKATLRLLDPAEIVMPDHMHDKHGAGRFLNESISKLFDDCEIQLVSKKHFNETAGVNAVKQYMAAEASNIDHTVFKKAYAMSSAFALLKYVEQMQDIALASKALRIRFESVEDSYIQTVENLELFYKRPTTKSAAWRCLYDRLNTCLTNGGTRTLRSCLLQPSADVRLLNERLDVVEELVKSPAMLDKIRSWLSGVQDLQHLITICVYTDNETIAEATDSRRVVRTRLVQLLSLRTMLKNTVTLKSFLSSSSCLFFMRNLQKISDHRLSKIVRCIDAKINETADIQKQRGSVAANDTLLNAVRDDDVKLSLARRAYAEIVNYVNELAKTEGFLKMGAVLSYTYGRGYHYAIKNTLNKRLTNDCIQVVHNRQTTTFTTLNLMRYNGEFPLLAHLFITSNVVIAQLLADIRQYVPALHNCVEFISQLDCFAALANYSAKLNDAVRPRFGPQLAIRGGKHPLLDDSDNTVVPNETFVSADTRFVLITGPNMAGKSTYIKQVCLLQILAQTGCFVPAKAASFVPRRHIFSRVGHNDDLGDNLSSFGVEMSEIAAMLQSATEHSLIIIDELARSTATEEGIAICFALCEKLIETKSFVFLATHFLDLCLLEAHFTVLRNFHFSANSRVDEDGTEFLVPSHILQPGPYKGPLYGLELAELTSLPDSVLTNARQLAVRLHSEIENQRSGSTKTETMARTRRFCHLAFRLMNLLEHVPNTTPEQLGIFLKNLQTKFVAELGPPANLS